jgi:hypothetical protein
MIPPLAAPIWPKWPGFRDFAKCGRIPIWPGDRDFGNPDLAGIGGVHSAAGPAGGVPRHACEVYNHGDDELGHLGSGDWESTGTPIMMPGPRGFRFRGLPAG